eukprot:4596513-Pyramimonas_sp.AAC.1
MWFGRPQRDGAALGGPSARVSIGDRVLGAQGKWAIADDAAFVLSVAREAQQQLAGACRSAPSCNINLLGNSLGRKGGATEEEEGGWMRHFAETHRACEILP